MSAPGKWEFPGGKLEKGETPEQALAREILEELGVSISVEEHLGRGHHGEVVLDVYVATVVSGEPSATEHAELDWLGPAGLTRLDWAEADVPIVPLVIAFLENK